MIWIGRWVRHESTVAKPWSTMAQTMVNERRRNGFSRFRPRSRTCASARAPSSRSTCCRSRPSVRIFPSTKNIPLSRLAPGAGQGKKGRAVGAAIAEGIRRHGAAITAWTVMYEEAARSIFGALAMNAMAPDDGNMNLLARIGTPAQKEWWLAPDRRGQGQVRLRDEPNRPRRRLRSQA